jgi:hypothetical protein
MADIYKNATLTLAATKSSDSTEGCFATSLDRHLSQNWRFVDAENTVYEIHVSREVDHERFLKPELPLLKRAWVLQEQLLSPRTVHFTTQKLVWRMGVLNARHLRVLQHRHLQFLQIVRQNNVAAKSLGRYPDTRG